MKDIITPLGTPDIGFDTISGLNSRSIAVIAFADSLRLKPKAFDVSASKCSVRYPYNETLWNLTQAWNGDRNCFAETKEFESSVQRSMYTLQLARKYKVFFSSKILRLLFRLFAEVRQYIVYHSY